MTTRKIRVNKKVRDPRPWTKTAANWIHRSGWSLRHCGHPTALWPWALYDHTGRLVLAPNGRAWSDLRSVADYVKQKGGK